MSEFPPESKPSKTEAEVEKILQHRFRNTDQSHPAIQALMKEARRHWRTRLEETDAV